MPFLVFFVEHRRFIWENRNAGVRFLFALRRQRAPKTMTPIIAKERVKCDKQEFFSPVKERLRPCFHKVPIASEFSSMHFTLVEIANRDYLHRCI